jgi:hypothetical protein
MKKSHVFYLIGGILVELVMALSLFGSLNGNMILHKIQYLCGSHPESCPVGQAIATAFGYRFEFRSVEGIANNKDILGGDQGLTIYDTKTGKFLQAVVYPWCNDNPNKRCALVGGDDWWVEGYRPVAKGEHVKDEIYALYKLICLLPECGERWSLDYITKLPDVTYVDPIVPKVRMSITVNSEEIGTFNAEDGMDIISDTIKTAKENKNP